MNLKFFLPCWPADGVVDYDFIQDQKLSDEKKRIWHVFDEPPIDGALISRANIDDTKWLRKEIKENGIHETLDYQGSVICDCGAFDYVDQEEPTYDPEETLEFYKEYGFDLGVTVDHLVVKSINPEDADESIELTEEDKEERIQITIDNAKKMMDLKESDEKYSEITLIGAVQGYDADSYRRCAEELINYGFDYIALGGLVRSNSDDIAEIVREVGSMIKEKEQENDGRDIRVHGFGIAREDLFDIMERNNFASFDSATYLRRAWLSKKNNYHIGDDAYSAVRIRYNNPYSNGTSDKEKEILQKFQSYAEGESDLDANDLIEILKDHEKELKEKGKIKKTTFENLANASEEYRRTLEEEPWEKCDCPACKNHGIHVCIFRGNERNMRRGFHNVYNFYNNISGSDQKSLESY